jgi:hypothetical protein
MAIEVRPEMPALTELREPEALLETRVLPEIEGLLGPAEE